jgi:hypothetical protein
MGRPDLLIALSSWLVHPELASKEANISSLKTKKERKCQFFMACAIGGIPQLALLLKYHRELNSRGSRRALGRSNRSSCHLITCIAPPCSPYLIFLTSLGLP